MDIDRKRPSKGRFNRGNSRSQHFSPPNVQQLTAYFHQPLLVGLSPSKHQCLKIRQFAVQALQFTASHAQKRTCSQSYPQKMGIENFHATRSNMPCRSMVASFGVTCPCQSFLQQGFPFLATDCGYGRNLNVAHRRVPDRRLHCRLIVGNSQTATTSNLPRQK